MGGKGSCAVCVDLQAVGALEFFGELYSLAKGFGPFLRGWVGFRERKGSIFSNHQHFAISTGICGVACPLPASRVDKPLMLASRWLNTPTRLLEASACMQLYDRSTTLASSRAYRQAGCVCDPTIFRLSTRGSKLRLDLSLGRWIYKVLRQHSRIDLSLLQHQSTSEEKHERLLKRGSGDCGSLRTSLCSVPQAANDS